MSEFRQDRTTGAWVIVAPERGLRPRPFHDGGTAKAGLMPGRDSSCPFCPGNESMLPGIIAEVATDAPPGWRARVIPNKYPALRAGDVTAVANSGAGLARPGHGYHEVVIETPRHDADLTTLPDAHIGSILHTYRDRFVQLSARPGIKAVVVFRNHGGRAGASVLHPHSQILAMAAPSPRWDARLARAQAHYERDGRCVTCDYLAVEAEDGRRIVAATERFLAFVPFAAASPFELWLLPRRHQASLAGAGEADLAELAPLLRRLLLSIRQVLDDPAYNYAFESGPPDDAAAPCTHWCLRIVPTLVRPGGFELGTGLPLNPSLPEDDAKTLRAAFAEATAGVV